MHMGEMREIPVRQHILIYVSIVVLSTVLSPKGPASFYMIEDAHPFVSRPNTNSISLCLYLHTNSTKFYLYLNPK